MVPKLTFQLNLVPKFTLGAEVHRLVPKLICAEVTRAEHWLPPLKDVRKFEDEHQFFRQIFSQNLTLEFIVLNYKETIQNTKVRSLFSEIFKTFKVLPKSGEHAHGMAGSQHGLMKQTRRANMEFWNLDCIITKDVVPNTVLRSLTPPVVKTMDPRKNMKPLVQTKMIVIILINLIYTNLTVFLNGHHQRSSRAKVGRWLLIVGASVTLFDGYTMVFFIIRVIQWPKGTMKWI